MHKKYFLIITFIVFLFSLQLNSEAQNIAFITQPPLPADFATINSTFANHRSRPEQAPFGGDLYIRYSDGTLKNLTEAAGYGTNGLQNSNSIVVRDPAVHWDGNKILFSMIIGAPTVRYSIQEKFWQLYEITGLGKNEAPKISKVQNQPVQYNNIMGTYSADDQIIFISDRPRNGEAHLYPQLDEYESTVSNTGVWKLNPQTGTITLLDHAPSGDFHPIVDSFGRIIFTRWDHLQRDQQAGGLQQFGAFNYSSESATALRINTQKEFFPEARIEAERTSAFENLHRMNNFFPWMINQDGTEAETLNHIGRHELINYFDRSLNNDPALSEFIPPDNDARIENFFQIKEDPNIAGKYYGINAPEFGTHASGQIVTLTAPVGRPADQIKPQYVTHPDTANASSSPSPSHTGLYRDPLPLSNGSLVSIHSGTTLEDSNIGSRANPQSRYQFRLRVLNADSSGFMTAGNFLTSGIRKNISFWDPDVLVTYQNVLMWELQPVEVRSRIRPTVSSSNIPEIEKNLFTETGVSLSAFQQFLTDNKLALIVSRDVTSRDKADKQQPYNLKVLGSNTATFGSTGKVYTVDKLQIFQGDQVRGYGGVNNPKIGRRVLANPMHEGATFISSSIADAKFPIYPDGSMAAFVPAERALTWQLTDPSGNSVVRERFWLTFKKGEIRVCTSCHGLNTTDQAGRGAPQNSPDALKALLEAWKQGQVIVPPPNGTEPKNAVSPKLSLKLMNSSLKSIRQSSSGSRNILRISPQNDAAKGQVFTVTPWINGKSCSSIRYRINNNGKTFRFQAPQMKVRLEFKATFNSILSGKTALRVAGKRLKSVSTSEFRKACRMAKLR